MQKTRQPTRSRRVSTAAAVMVETDSKQSRSPPCGGVSWKWSETENHWKPRSSANFHRRRISARGPPRCPTWMPKFMGIIVQDRGWYHDLQMRYLIPFLLSAVLCCSAVAQEPAP